MLLPTFTNKNTNGIISFSMPAQRRSEAGAFDGGTLVIVGTNLDLCADARRESRAQPIRMANSSTEVYTDQGYFELSK